MATFNVLVSGLPFRMRHNKAMATVIANGVGDFVELPSENSTHDDGMSLRIKIKMDITKPLKRALRVKCVNGEAIMVTFTYERLPNFCYRCGIIGHLLKDCKIQFDIEAACGDVSEDSMEWGPWLRATTNPQRNRLLGGADNTPSTRIFDDRKISPENHKSGTSANFGKIGDFYDTAQSHAIIVKS